MITAKKMKWFTEYWRKEPRRKNTHVNREEVESVKKVNRVVVK
jgi:hypothetical protein